MAAVTAKELAGIVDLLLIRNPKNEYKEARKIVEKVVVLTGKITASDIDDVAWVYVELKRDGESSFMQIKINKCDSFDDKDWEDVEDD